MDHRLNQHSQKSVYPQPSKHTSTGGFIGFTHTDKGRAITMLAGMTQAAWSNVCLGLCTRLNIYINININLNTNMNINIYISL